MKTTFTEVYSFAAIKSVMDMNFPHDKSSAKAADHALLSPESAEGQLDLQTLFAMIRLRQSNSATAQLLKGKVQESQTPREDATEKMLLFAGDAESCPKDESKKRALAARGGFWKIRAAINESLGDTC